MHKIFLAHFIWVFSLLGWGRLACRFFGFYQTREEKIPYGLLGMAGMALLAFTALALNFFFALSPALRICLCGLGLVAFLINPSLRISWIASLGFFLALFYLSVGNYFSTLDFDASLYYSPLIQWFHEGPTPLGLSNLYIWYGHNSSWIALQAALHLPWLGWASAFSANSILLLFLYWFLLESLRKEAKGLRIIFASTFSFLVLEGFFGSYLTWIAVSASTNLPVAAFTVVITFLQFAALVRPPTLSEKRILLTLATFLFTIKASSLITLGFTVLIVYWPRFKKGLFPVGALLLLLAFLIHGVMTSGCLLYPLAITRLPLSWSASFEQLSYATQNVLYFARQVDILMGPQIPTSLWFYPWFKDQFFSLRMVLFAVCFVLGFFLFPKEKKLLGIFVILMGEQLLNIGLTLIAFPGVRYAYGSYVLLGSLGAGCLLERTKVNAVKVFRFGLAALIVYTVVHQRFIRNYVGWWNLWPHFKETTPYHALKKLEPIVSVAPGLFCVGTPVPCTPLCPDDITASKSSGRWVFELKPNAENLKRSEVFESLEIRNSLCQGR